MVIKVTYIYVWCMHVYVEYLSTLAVCGFESHRSILPYLNVVRSAELYNGDAANLRHEVVKVKYSRIATREGLEILIQAIIECGTCIVDLPKV